MKTSGNAPSRENPSESRPANEEGITTSLSQSPSVNIDTFHKENQDFIIATCV